MKNKFPDELKKYKTSIELLVSIFIFIPLVVNGGIAEKFDFFGVVYSLLAFIIILELVRMVGEYIFKNHVELRLIFDTFIIFMTREIVLLYSNKNILLETKVLYISLGLVIIYFMFKFRSIAIRTHKEWSL